MRKIVPAAFVFATLTALAPAALAQSVPPLPKRSVRINLGQTLGRYTLGSSPNWTQGYIPTATEWNNEWASKQDFGGNGSALTALSNGATTSRTLASHFGDVVNVMDYGAKGDGTSDDAAAINAAIASATAGGGAQEVFFPAPPGGFYAVCSAPVTLPGATATLQSLRLVGPAGGSAMIRIKPGCASPPQEVVYQGSSATQNDISRVTISHLTIDGYCLASYDLYVGYAVDFSVDHVAFRNAATGGANVRLAGGYEYDIGNTNTAENVNDSGHTCYSSAAALPLYNLWTSATDSRFDGLVAIDAATANIYQDNGGNNRFIGTHTWNYVSPIDLRSQYGYSLKGSAMLIGSYAEDYTGSGIYLQPQPSSTFSGARIIGNNFDFTGNPASTVLGVEIESGATYAEVTANNAWQINYIGHPENIVKQDGTADPSTLVFDNLEATYSAGVLPTNPLLPKTVATLGTCSANNEGVRYLVTDASAPAWNSALVGGGSVHVVAVCTSGTWTAH